MSETFLRKIAMLKIIPRYRPGLTAGEIHNVVQEREFEVSRRTVERDLVELQIGYPIESEGNPQRWFWSPNAPIETLPTHDTYSALTFRLIEDHLSPLLPDVIRRQIAPHFDAARKLLDQHQSAQKLKRWYGSVRVLSRALPLQPPHIDTEILQLVYEALWERDQLKVSYQGRGESEPREMTLHPQGLVLRDGLMYLLATINNYSDIRHIALHRIRTAKNCYRDSTIQSDFDLDRYIEEGGFAYVQGRPIEVVVHFDPYIAQHLLETPLHENQQYTELDDGRVEIRATVADTHQLRWWLLGFGAGVEVIAPENLRQEMAEQAAAMHRHYSG